MSTALTPAALAVTTGEAAVAVAVIVAVTALVLVVVWQLFSLARRGMELRVGDHRDATTAERSSSSDDAS